jgi:hypothetical protein
MATTVGLAGNAIGVYVPQTIEKAVAEGIGMKEIKLITRHTYDGVEIVTHILSSIWKTIDKVSTVWETAKKIQKNE